MLRVVVQEILPAKTSAVVAAPLETFLTIGIWKGCLYVCFKRLTTSPDNIRTAMAALHILAWLPWQLTATPWTKHVIVVRHYSSCMDLGAFIHCRPF